MRMTFDELAFECGGDILEREARLLLGQLAIEDDLKQQIAEFTRQCGEIVCFDRSRHLIGFLDGMRDDGPKILAQIPGASAVRIAQLAHDGP